MIVRVSILNESSPRTVIGPGAVFDICLVIYLRGRDIKGKKLQHLGDKKEKTIDKRKSMVYNGTPYCGSMRTLPNPHSAWIFYHSPRELSRRKIYIFDNGPRRIK